MFGGIWNALTGKTNYRASAPSMQAGQEALKRQMQAQAGRNMAQQYSLASSARGPSSALAVREAQRRSDMAGQAATEQAGILSNQLAQQQMNQQMQAQQINAQIAQHNAGGLQRFAGGIIGAGAGAMMLSDARAKEAAFSSGYQSAMAAGGDDGRRVQWVNSGPDERDAVAAHAKQSGVALTPQDWGAMGYAAPGQAPQPMGAQQQPAAAPAAPQPSMREQMGQRLLLGSLGGYMDSDERAKVLADENKALKDALGSLRTALEAQQAPTPTLQRGLGPRAARVTTALARVPREREMTPAEQQELDWAIEDATLKGNPANNGAVVALGTRQPGVAAIPQPVMERNAALAEKRVAQPVEPPMLDSDEDEKEGLDGIDRMEFPEGVEPVAFRYKPGAGDGGVKPHVGVLAQDVEESPEGATVVEEGPDGMKRLDIGGLAALNTAKLSELEKRLRKLEGR